MGSVTLPQWAPNFYRRAGGDQKPGRQPAGARLAYPASDTLRGGRKIAARGAAFHEG